MINKKSLVLAVIVAIIVLAIGLNFSKVKNLGSGVIVTDYYRYSTSTIYSWSASTTAMRIVPRNVDRQYLEICNIGAPIVYLYGTTSTTSLDINFGQPLYASTSASGPSCRFWKTDDELYLGAIYAFASPTGTVSIIER